MFLAGYSVLRSKCNFQNTNVWKLLTVSVRSLRLTRADKSNYERGLSRLRFILDVHLDNLIGHVQGVELYSWNEEGVTTRITHGMHQVVNID